MNFRELIRSVRETRHYLQLSAACLPAFALSGCYVVPVAPGPDGTPHYVYSSAPVVPAPAAPRSHPAVVATGPMPAALPIKLYPINDLANQTGVLTGQVTNLMTGKGRFTFNYQGETLVGEATRVANNERHGVASAYGPRGSFARCEYQMSTALMGAGTCSFSNGAQYQVHVGN
jgi:hypothetical protein